MHDGHGGCHDGHPAPRPAGEVAEDR
jgi:hypothetical protein